MASERKNGDKKRSAAETKKAVGARIREARKALGWTAEELGRRLRLTTNHVYVLERGEVSPSARTLNALAKATGRSAAWFKTGATNGNGNGGERK
jgi:transcriptional regulator with XRE-family HTH domain